MEALYITRMQDFLYILDYYIFTAMDLLVSITVMGFDMAED